MSAAERLAAVRLALEVLVMLNNGEIERHHAAALLSELGIGITLDAPRTS